MTKEASDPRGRVRGIDLIAVAAGGAIGASLRVAFSALHAALPGQMPWATLSENVLGALLLGAMLVALADRAGIRGPLFLFWCTGILGSFTTFSNFSLEIVELSREGRYLLAIAYPLASIGLGLLAAMAGMQGARRLLARKRPP